MPSPYRKKMMAEWNRRKKLRKAIIAQMVARGDSRQSVHEMRQALHRHTMRDARKLGIF